MIKSTKTLTFAQTSRLLFRYLSVTPLIDHSCFSNLDVHQNTLTFIEKNHSCSFETFREVCNTQAGQECVALLWEIWLPVILEQLYTPGNFTTVTGDGISCETSPLGTRFQVLRTLGPLDSPFLKVLLPLSYTPPPVFYCNSHAYLCHLTLLLDSSPLRSFHPVHRPPAGPHPTA